MTAHRTPEPRGPTAAFVAAVATKYGTAFAQSWLSARSCRFTDTTVFTIAFARDTIATYCADIAAEHGVTIAVDADLTRHFYAEVDQRGARP